MEKQDSWSKLLLDFFAQFLLIGSAASFFVAAAIFISVFVL